MAKLKTLRFRRQNKAGEVMEFTAECSVNQQGTFSINIPDDLSETAMEMREPSIEISRERVYWRVSSSRLDAAIHFVNRAIDEHLSVGVKKDLVICYTHNTKVAYFENSDGTIHPNGTFGNYDGGPGNAWRGSLDGASNQAAFYFVGFAARAFERNTYTRTNQTKVSFSQPAAAHHDKGPLGRLNAFAGLGGFIPNKDTEWVPYTDEAAEFFTKMMLGMCDLARKLDRFIGNKDALQLAIRSGTPLIGATQEGGTS